MDRNTKQNEQLPTNFLIENYNRLWSSILINELVLKGITNFFISPGMRNAPLLSAISANKSTIKHSIIDERSAAYSALGFSKVANTPSVLICTSGSALNNYQPAICEAYKSAIPIIIISADRPYDLVESGGNQTINQPDALINWTSHQLNVGPAGDKISLKNIRSLFNTIISKSIGGISPVHINVQFCEPIDKTVEDIRKDDLSALTGTNLSRPYCKNLIPTISFDNSQEQTIKDLFKKFKNPLIAIGQNSVPISETLLNEIVAITNWPIFIDATSKLNYKTLPNLISNFQNNSNLSKLDNFKIDSIISLGSRFVSKYFYKFIQDNNLSIIQVEDDLNQNDPSFNINHKIKCHGNSFLAALKTMASDLPTPLTTNFNSPLPTVSNIDLLKPFVAQETINLIKSDSNLIIGNSSIIRIFDSLSYIENPKDLTIITNRGTSGIEGFISMSYGVCMANKKPTTTIIGDISALHDIGSLQLLSNSNLPITIIILNDFEGGIFNEIDINIEDEAKNLMTTGHEHNFTQVSKSFNIDSITISTPTEFSSAYNQAIKNNCPTILNLIIDSKKNSEEIKRLMT